jgi:aquaporin Z
VTEGVANEDRNRRPPLSSRLLAEMIGTLILTFVAAGGDVVDAVSGSQIGHAARYLAPGLIVIALIYATSGISGAHINPAVTLAFLVRRSFPFRRAVLYWLVQLVGAVTAGLLLRMFFGATLSHGVTRPGIGMTPLAAAGWECALTMVLVLVILGTSEQQAVVGKNAAMAVGFTVATCGLFSSPVSGASMNPARSLGPAVASLDFSSIWVYLVGPIAGACLAAGLVQLIYGSPTRGEREAAHGKHV